MTETQKIQKLILYIANEVIRICDKNDIPYNITAGTLLGAVRHKGFIPWDDDFDFAMTRNDYERFLKACKKDLNTDIFFLQTAETDRNFAYSMAKLQLLGTEIIEDFSIGVDIHHGIFVDIFPYDKLPDGDVKRKKFLKKNHLLKTMLWIKCGYGVKEHSGRTGYKILHFLGRFVTVEKLKKKIYAHITKYNNTNFNDCFTSDYPDEKMEEKWLVNRTEYPFEGYNFKGFRDYDEYLSSLYGDYMTLPPENERETHTNAKVDYGQYDKWFEE